MLPKFKTSMMALALSAIIVLVVLLGPSEAELGSNVRIVYLHGAWVWTALIGFAAAAFTGAVGLITSQKKWLHQSKVLGQIGALFWITYLPLSLWAMQANWNGLFLLEPRWRIGVDFALVAALLQAAILLLRLPRLTGSLNIAFTGGLFWSLNQAEQIMHPPSPITSSGSSMIQSYFFFLSLLCLLFAWLISRILLNWQTQG